ncbi:hypothetical protein DDZ18_12515 [Marinicauda salina]|uniref:Uncharacterized protein n=1 Tax=Marinicauda salina TaxID=2135793 RepID=A0A2U2BRE5_9PROT|nr:hypothetical protein [Marinicauda salina]PWE16584.1 hypothetical protein DDZ18_12515 [Marinicauda salina]
MSEAAHKLGEGALSADKLAAANIHPETGLATDYLNHFNEVAMMMEMLPDMPDCAEDVLAWEPLDYEAHFERSGFAAKALAIKAYRAAPRALRAHLETIVLSLNAEIGRAKALLETGDPDAPAQVARLAGEEIHPLIAAASNAIHGRIEGEDLCEDCPAQADVDALFA